MYARKQKTGIYFLGYLLFDLIILLTIFYLRSNTEVSNNSRYLFMDTSNHIIAVVEILAYYSYFFFLLWHNTKDSSFLYKKLFACLLSTYMIVLVLSLIFNWHKFFFLIDAFGFILLILPCLIYYKKYILNTESSIKLTQRPSFWIVTGVFFFSCMSLPFYLGEHFLSFSSKRQFNLLAPFFYYTPLALNYFSLSKAFLCKKILTT